MLGLLPIVRACAGHPTQAGDGLPDLAGSRAKPGHKRMNHLSGTKHSHVRLFH